MLIVKEKKSRQLQRVREDKPSENNCAVVTRKRVQAESFQQNLQNRLLGRGDLILQLFPTNHVEQFLVSMFWGSFWKS